METANPATATKTLSAESASLSMQRCVLIEVEGPTPGTAHELRPQKTVVGKSPECDIPIDDATVSRRHFEIEAQAGRFRLRDLGSTNGTFLDGAEIKEAFLRPGMLIKAGEVVLRFQSAHQPVELPPSERDRFGRLIGRSLAMRQLFALLEKVAPTESTILILGETGSGKGEAVRAVHENSPRRKGPLVVMDCGAVAPTLIESELFGHVRGAFTGANVTRKGALEICRGGTLFIDELDDLPLELQPKLLRALEEREFSRLGANQKIDFDSRVIAASKRDLWAMVQQGQFREDLYFRLSVVCVKIPPLRQRGEDIPALFDHFAAGRQKFSALTPELQQRWLEHNWPGNVRELRNAVERSLALGAFDPLPPEQQTAAGPSPGGLRPEYHLPFKEAKDRLIEAFEREYLRRLLAAAQGGIAGAARQAGIDRKHLYKLMEKYGLGRSEMKEE
jgi:DNA-binding NtrC family response regulator